MSESEPFKSTGESKPSAANGSDTSEIVTPVRHALVRYERFLIPALVLLVLGNALAVSFPGSPATDWHIISPLLLMLFGLLCASKRGWILNATLWLMLFLLGSLYGQWRQFEPSAMDVSRQAPANAAHLSAVFEEQKPGKSQAILSIIALNGKPAAGRALFYEPAGSRDRFQPGDRMRLVADVALPHTADIPGNFDQSKYLAGQHVTALVRNASDVQLIPAPLSPYHRLLRLTAGLRARIADTFKNALPSPHAEVLGGLVLGDRAVPVDRQTKSEFIDTGLIHVLAASGMNVGIIAGALIMLLTALKLPFRPRIIIALAGVWFYSLLTGLPPSIIRATAMLTLALLLKLVKRELSPLLLLCVAVTALVLIQPDQLSSIGFQFSVLTTFGLMAMIPPIEERIERPALKWVAGIILVPLIAQLWITPLTVLYFNRLALQSIPLNVAALALVTPLTILGFAAGVLSLFWQAGASVLAGFSQPFLSALLGLVSWGSSWDGALLNLASPASWLITALYGVLLIWLLLIKLAPAWPWPRLAMAALTPLIALLVVFGIDQNLQQRQARMEILPLSYGRHAMLLHPANSSQTVAVLPRPLLLFEGMALNEALKHRNIDTLSGVVMMPTELPRHMDVESATGLKLLAGKVTVQRWLNAPGQPQTQLPLAWGDFQLRMHGGPVSALEVSRHGRCILSWQRDALPLKECLTQQVSLPQQHLIGAVAFNDQQVQRLTLSPRSAIVHWQGL